MSEGRGDARRVPRADTEPEARSAHLGKLARQRRTKWNVPVAARDQYSRNVMKLVARTGDFIREKLAQDQETALAYWKALQQGVRAGDRTAMHLYSKVLKLVDEEKTVVVTVLHQLGMSSMEELERLVQTHKDVGSTTPEQKFSVVMDYAELFLNANPEYRVQAVRRLGGEVAVTSGSYAVVKDWSDSEGVAR